MLWWKRGETSPVRSGVRAFAGILGSCCNINNAKPACHELNEQLTSDSVTILYLGL